MHSFQGFFMFDAELLLVLDGFFDFHLKIPGEEHFLLAC
jgi:hypothetical protein